MNPAHSGEAALVPPVPPMAVPFRSEGVNGRVDETDRSFALRRSLLVDQRHESSPQRGSGASAAGPANGSALFINRKDTVGRDGHIRIIALGDRPEIEGHADSLLPGGNSVAADAAAAAAPCVVR